MEENISRTFSWKWDEWSSREYDQKNGILQAMNVHLSSISFVIEMVEMNYFNVKWLRGWTGGGKRTWFWARAVDYFWSPIFIIHEKDEEPNPRSFILWPSLVLSFPFFSYLLDWNGMTIENPIEFTSQYLTHAFLWLLFPSHTHSMPQKSLKSSVLLQAVLPWNNASKNNDLVHKHTFRAVTKLHCKRERWFLHLRSLYGRSSSQESPRKLVFSLLPSPSYTSIYSRLKCSSFRSRSLIPTSLPSLQVYLYQARVKREDYFTERKTL